MDYLTSQEPLITSTEDDDTYNHPNLSQIYASLTMDQAHNLLISQLEIQIQNDIFKKNHTSCIDVNPFHPFMKHFKMYRVLTKGFGEVFLSMYRFKMATCLAAKNKSKYSYIIIHNSDIKGRNWNITEERVHTVTDLSKYYVVKIYPKRTILY